MQKDFSQEKFIADYHVHSEFSDDSVYPMEEVVRDAVAMGIGELCFTDHVDYGVKRDWDDPLGVEYRAGGPGEPEKMAVAEAGPYPFEKIRRIVSEILKTVIADGKGIEVNTSSHRYKLSDLTPSRDILRLYRELGGKILTIGSDSHKREHLGAYIPETMEELKKLGFESFCTFEKMKPVFHAL